MYADHVRVYLCHPFIKIDDALLSVFALIKAMPCCDDESGDNSSSQIAPHFGSVICTGKENNITECSYSTQNISAQQDIGVHCQQGELELDKQFLKCSFKKSAGNQAREGEIRLVEGDSPWEGRVEIHLSREWGTISDAEYYDSREATVVCRQLGYNFYSRRFKKLFHY